MIQNWIQNWLDRCTLNKYKKLIENTAWIVPPPTLLAIDYDNGETTSVSDQTVWVINTFENGYFFGDSYTSINQVPVSHMQIVGSVTTLGDVYITFYPTTSEGSPVTGLGVFTKKQGRHAFIMQMNTAHDNTSGLAHWSYMISVKKGDFFYKHLPGENMSVPQFISQF